MNRLEDLREWLLDRIDGGEEMRGEDSLISHFINQIDALPSEMGTTPFEIRKKIMTAHMLAESIVERATVETPRTDAAEVTMLRLDGDADVVVAAFFARQLERELIAARSATAALPVEEGAIREALKWCRGAASNDRWSEENLRHQIITRADEALNRSYTR